MTSRDDHVEAAGLQRLEHLLAIAGLRHPHAVLAEKARQHDADLPIIVDDQYVRFGLLDHGAHLARIPAKGNHFAEKDSRQINMLEQILIAKVCNFGGICSWSGSAPHRPC
jgi:hypothetical protein